MLPSGQGERRAFMHRTTISAEDSADEQREEQIRRNRAVIVLLNAWELEDADEQRETLEFLMRALDEDRLSSRRLIS
jgi:hypothetical protein